MKLREEMIMNNQNRSLSKKDIVLKIFVPIVLVVIIAGIWFVKNAQEKPPIVNTENSAFDLNIAEKLDIEKLKSYGLPILIEFGSESCPPCKEMAPVIENLNKELRGKAIIKYMDVWEHPDWSDGYPLTVIPTQLFIDAEGNPYNPKDPEASKIKIHTDDTNKHTFTTHEGIISKENLVSILEEMGMK
ncbi:MAG: Thioredoxin [Oscillospiraceae bacterium]|nr:Thioredoxin [Oscillospiraceae bacterium]